MLYLYFGLLLSMLNILGSLTKNIPPNELDALYDLYTSTNGDNWHWHNNTSEFGSVPWNFTSDCNPCEDHWQGITCSDEIGSTYRHIIQINLVEHNLRGNLPVGLSNLTKVVVLILSTNFLQSSIPMELARMRDLNHIDLSSNAITGSLNVFNSLYNLTSLVLGYNLFNGTIPPEWNGLRRLQTLVMGFNQITGTFPVSLGNLTELVTLYCDGNFITGTVPATFVHLQSLQTLAVEQNILSGSFPEFLCNLTSLQILAMYGNPMSGTIPDCLGGALSSLRYLLMYDMDLTGTLPESLGNLANLELLWVQENPLVGSIPVQLEGLTQLQQFIAYDCSLSGSIPSGLGKLSLSIDLQVQGNQLTGPIPSALGQLALLQYLFLNNNLLTGSIPASISQLGALQELQLQNNLLSGALVGVFNASVQNALLIAEVSYNQLTGTLPGEVFQLPALNTFVAVSNCFTGTLPEVICSNTALVSLILDGLQTAPACRQRLLKGSESQSYIVANHFNGRIPPCLFNLPNLTSLHLSGNGLAGSLPTDLVVSNRLVDLTLSHNALTGSIPRAIQRRMWKKLDLSYNRLSGVLDSDFATQRIDFSLTLDGETYNLTDAVFPTTYSLQNNRLSRSVPSTLVNRFNVSLLGSNMFECNVQKSDLPQHDNQRSNYQCGSDSFDRPFYLWLAVCFGIAVFIVAAVRCVSTVKRSAVITHVLECLQKWNLPQEELPRNFRYVSSMSDILCQISVWCTALILLVLVPWYTVATHYYGTYSHQYAWAVSAAFLSGPEATAVQLVVYVLVLAVMVGALVFLLLRYDREQHHIRSRLDTYSKDGRYELKLDEPRTLAQRLLVYWAFALVNIVVVGGVNASFVLISLSEDNRTLVSAQIGLSLFKLGWNTAATPYLIRTLSEYISHTAQTTGFVTVQVVMALFNNIAIPCLIVAAISPGCFYAVFHSAPSVTSLFVYLSCVLYSSSGACNAYEPVFLQTSYAPPFRYDYQCSSSFVTYYAPAFVYLGIAAAVAVPALKVMAQQLQKRCKVDGVLYRLLNRVIPRILRPLLIVFGSRASQAGSSSLSELHDPAVDTAAIPSPNSGSSAVGRNSSITSFNSSSSRSAITYETLQRDLFHPVFDANIFIISLVTYLGILLTFGVVFPPLAVVMCVTMLSVAWQAKLEVGRFLCTARELRAYKFEDIIEQECKGAVTIPKLRRSVFIILAFSCCFYALFLFDTLGNSAGLVQSFWLLILLPLLPVALACANRLRQWKRGQVFFDQTIEEEEFAVVAPSSIRMSEFKRSSRQLSTASAQASVSSTGSSPFQAAVIPAPSATEQSCREKGSSNGEVDSSSECADPPATTAAAVVVSALHV